MILQNYFLFIYTFFFFFFATQCNEEKNAGMGIFYQKLPMHLSNNPNTINVLHFLYKQVISALDNLRPINIPKSQKLGRPPIRY